MPDQSPPARRRPPTGSAPSVNRPPARRTGAQPPVSRSPAPESAGPKLVCTAGPRAGTEFLLSGDDEIVIGRATDIVVSIPDTSVSRRHCGVRQTDGTWSITDLGSGNGTVVNGERIEGDMILGNGDVITVGDTEFTFQDTANATDRRPMPTRRPASGAAAAAPPPPRRSTAGRPDVRARLSRGGAPAVDPAKKRKMMLIAGGVVVVLFGGFVAAKVVIDRRNKANEELQGQEAAFRRELSGMFQEGKNLVREGRWAEAKTKFEEVAGRNPNYPGVQDYLTRTTIEIPNKEYLTAAEEALAANKLAEAAAALKQVTRDTQQMQKLGELKDKLNVVLKKQLKDVPGLLATASVNKEERRAAYTRVLEMTADILRLDPENTDALRFSKDAKEKLAALDYVAPPPPGKVIKPWEPVVSLFAAGDMTAALSTADACAGRDRTCKEKAKDIREFMGLNKRVEDLDGRSLGRLLALDKEISNGAGSPMGRTAGKRAANIYYKTASSSKNAGQWGPAMQWAQKTLAADPSHQGAKTIVDEIRAKANEEYLRCYALKDSAPDEALPCFKSVLMMCSRGDTTYVKTQSRIEALEAQR